jgi:hypothetical protein
MISNLQRRWHCYQCKDYAISWQEWQAAPNDGMVVEKQLNSLLTPSTRNVGSMMTPAVGGLRGHAWGIGFSNPCV